MQAYDVYTVLYDDDDFDKNFEELKGRFSSANIDSVDRDKDDNKRVIIWIDTVFFDDSISKGQVRDSLINHDGYPIPCYVDKRKKV